MTLNDLIKSVKPNSAYLFFDEINRFYFTGFKSTAGYLLITDSCATLYIDNRYYHHAVSTLQGVQVKPFTTFDDFIVELKNLGILQLFIDYSVVTVEEYNQFIFNGFKVLDCSKVVKEIALIKSDSEVENIKCACDIAYNAFIKLLPYIKKGVTERQLKNISEDYMRDLGSNAPSFDTIIAFGANSAIPHHETGDTKLCDNQPILMDFGATFNGYASDITRTLYFGEPTKEFIFAYDSVLKANLLAEDEITSNISCKDADRIARDYLTNQGFGENFTHSLGHGVGLRIHESPTLSPRSNEIMKDGMVFTVEPGVYFNGKFGIRIEDTCLLKNGKTERLFTDDKKLIVINDKKL